MLSLGLLGILGVSSDCLDSVLRFIYISKATYKLLKVHKKQQVDISGLKLHKLILSKRSAWVYLSLHV